MSWADLFERAEHADATVAAIRSALASRRADEGGDGSAGRASGGGGEREAGTDDGPDPGGEPVDPGPARVVADADVLAADLLVGDAARDALDHLRAHSWTALVASDPLVADAAAVVAAVADADLAADWRAQFLALRDPVAHPAGDHPALASAYRGGAMHVLTFDEGLRSADAGAAIRGRVETSVKHPRAFATLFDAASLYEAVAGGEYPGPDRDPRE